MKKLLIALVATLVAVSVGLIGGTIVGILSAYFGGLVDLALMRFMELLFSFPAILLAIVLMASLGTSILNAMIAIGIIFIYAGKLLRPQVQSSRLTEVLPVFSALVIACAGLVICYGALDQAGIFG